MIKIAEENCGIRHSESLALDYTSDYVHIYGCVVLNACVCVCVFSCALWYLHIKRSLNVLNIYLFIYAFLFLVACLIRKYFAFKHTQPHTLIFLIVCMTGVQNSTKFIQKYVFCC